MNSYKHLPSSLDIYEQCSYYDIVQHQLYKRDRSLTNLDIILFYTAIETLLIACQIYKTVAYFPFIFINSV